MKYKFYPPRKPHKPTYTNRFLPSITFVVFSRKFSDKNYEKQGIYCRRIPHIMKIKVELLNRFQSSLIVPIGKDKTPNYYLEVEPKSFWNDPEFISRFSRFDYLVAGSLSLDVGEMEVHVYSKMDNKIIYQRKFSGIEEDFFDFANEFVIDLMHFFEVNLSPQDIDTISKRPISKKEALYPLLEALDKDPENQIGGDYKTYIDRLKTAFKMDPSSEDVVNMLLYAAEYVDEEGDLETAHLVLDFILSLMPLNYKANQYKIYLLSKENKIDEAMSFLEKIVDKDDKFKEIPFHLGIKFMEKREWDLSSLLFEKAMKYQIKEPYLYEVYSYLMASLENYEKALNIVEEGFKQHLFTEYLLLIKAQILAIKGEIEKAEKTYQEALDIYVNSSRLKASAAAFYINVGKPHKSKILIDDALEESPEDPVVNIEGARIYVELDDKETALRLAKTAVDLKPEEPLFSMAEKLISRITSGISEEEQARNRLLFSKAVKILEEGNIDLAITLLEEVVKAEPSFWKGWFILGVAYRKKEEYEKALKAFSKVDELYPDQVSLHHEIGKCKMAMDKYKEAFPHLLYAFRRKPNDPEIVANMGILYLLLRRVPEAEALLFQAQRMAPEIDLSPYIKQLEKIKKRKIVSGKNGELKTGEEKEEKKEEEEN